MTKARTRPSPAKANWAIGLIGRRLLSLGGVFSGRVRRTTSAQRPTRTAIITMKGTMPIRSEKAAARAGPIMPPSAKAAVMPASACVRSDGANASFLRQATQPLDVRRLIFRPFPARELDQGDRALDPTDDCAVPRRHVHYKIRGNNGGGTGLVLGDELRIARNVLSKVTAHQASIGVIPATGTRPYNNLDPFVLIKSRDVIGRKGAGGNA